MSATGNTDDEHTEVTLDLTTEPSDDGPDGCLGCNHDDVAAFLKLRGISESAFIEVTEPRHAWDDVLRCGRCGKSWLLMKGNR